jgi:Protein of unknown function (DUF2721)
MPETSPLLDHFDVAISHAAAPAFMLGAVAAFLNVLVNRFERAVDRYRTLRAETSSSAPTDIMASLSARMVILDHAILLAALSGLCTAALLIDLFVCALLDIPYGAGVATLFALALLLLMVSIVELIRDVRRNLRALHLE